MKFLINIVMLSLSIFIYGQTYLVDQHFSNVIPTGWSSTGSPTSPIWNLNRNESATGNYRNVFDATTYSARFPSASNGNSVFLYIPINFVNGNTYTITFYTKRACSVRVYTNELPNQTTLLTKDSSANNSCNSNWSIWYKWTFTIISNYTGNGYFQIGIKTVYGGPASVYLDDLTIYESPPINLPIELVSFIGTTQNNVNTLMWVTASEHNNHYFTLERTSNGIDFEVIANIEGAGNSSEMNEYTVIDPIKIPIINYYKLKQTDYDGKFIYSDIISVDNRIKAKIVSRMVSLMGTEVNEMYRGIVIIEYTDGSVEKIIR